MKRVFVLLLLFAALFPLASAETMRVGIYDNAPKIWMENGEAKGFWPVIVNHIAEQEGWDVEWVYGDWDELMQKTQTGEIDIMPDVALLEERAEKGKFGKEPVLVSWSVVFVPLDSEIESIVDLEGKRVAVLRDSINYVAPDGITVLADRFDVNMEFIEFNSYDEAFAAVRDGEADAAVSNRFFGKEHETEYGLTSTEILLCPMKLYFYFPPDTNSSFIEVVDQHISQIRADSESVYYTAVREQLMEEPFVMEVIPFWVWWIGAGLFLALVFFCGFAIASCEKKEFFKALFECSVQPSVLIDEEGTIAEINRSAVISMGYLPEEAKGKHFSNFLLPEYLGSASAMFERFKKTKVSSPIELGIKTKSGKSKIFSAFAIPVKKGRNRYMLITFEDKTRVKELWKQVEELERKKRRK